MLDDFLFICDMHLPDMVLILYTFSTLEDGFDVVDALLDLLAIVFSFAIFKQSLRGGQKMIFLVEFLRYLDYLFIETIYFFVELGSLEIEFVL